MARRSGKKLRAKEAARKANVARTTMHVLGIGIIATAALIIATKKVFDEIFVEDDWSDVDWGDEDEDLDIDIDGCLL